MRLRKRLLIIPDTVPETDEENYDWLFSFTNGRDKDLPEQLSVD